MDQVINWLKAIGIILVVLGHSAFQTPIECFVGLFHISIFYFTAGYCFKDKYIDTPFIFLKKRILGLYIPFVKWGLIFLLLHNFLLHISVYSYNYGYLNYYCHIYEYGELITLAKETLKFNHTEPLLGGYWFLKSLFWGSLISYSWLLLAKKIHINYLFGYGGALVLILFNSFHLQVPSLLIGGREIAAALIFLSGYSFKHFKIATFSSRISIVLIVFLLICGYNFWKISLTPYYYDNWKIFPYLVSTILIVWSIYSLLKTWELKISFGKYLNYIGSITLPILTWHFLVFKLVSILIVFLYNLPFEQIAEFPVIAEYSVKGWWIAYFICSIFFISGFQYIIDKAKKRKS